jgi:hypothetical protein
VPISIPIWDSIQLDGLNIDLVIKPVGAE